MRRWSTGPTSGAWQGLRRAGVVVGLVAGLLGTGRGPAASGWWRPGPEAGQPVPPPAVPLPVVVVDPGHGYSPAEGSYTGAYNAALGLHEDTFNLDIGLRLAAALRARGAEVYLTRTGDEEPADYNGDGERTNADRSYLALHLREHFPQAARGQADAYVSVHLNGSRDSRKRGTTSVYSQAGPAARYAAVSAQLSSAIHRRLVTVLPESAPPFAVNGLYMDRLALPHAIVEVVFITNRADAAWVQDASHRQLAAELIADGVMEWWWSQGRWQSR